MRAIDLYSGVGGWSLGLRLAGIEVVTSYERWGPANETNFKNNLHQAQTVDIRRLTFTELPKDIDIVVGSPPCTQFSFSNRGGSGDIDDGLEDIIRFLSIVNHLRPKVWAMENVPRVAPIIRRELLEGGRLHQFAHLGLEPHVVNMEDFGVPQRRRRCIAGNFDFSLLKSYAEGIPKHTLGEVVAALAADPVFDPIFGLTMSQAALVDHDAEESLNAEEVRINRAAKVTHPVYNAMPFPDPLNRSVRTITATCTRVSRESIIIESPGAPNTFRRLTVRERASLQGFPITFQFYGSSHSQKLRMIGNAIPPAFSFLVAQAFLGCKSQKLPTLEVAAADLTAPTPPPIRTAPDQPGATYPLNRNFRFAITSLRLKSGVRFELVNMVDAERAHWKVAFWFGTSKSIQTLPLDEHQYRDLSGGMPAEATQACAAPLERLVAFIRRADVSNMQTLWSHRGPGETRAFMLLDELNEIGSLVKTALGPHDEAAQAAVMTAIARAFNDNAEDIPGVPKLVRNAPLILAGLLVGSLANVELGKHADFPARDNRKHQIAAKRR
ncbi:DNA cytosine methyltransferase [Mesorhizobium sp. M0915]|uniref:DNA cytosine methyltransferase n=1 Tax=Mesorhizobium sp. M0915 TaxID=2957027 RepID=UPI00333AAA98